MGTLYQRVKGGNYYGYWTDRRGKEHRQTLRTRDRKVATERLRACELAATDPATHSHHTLTAALAHLVAAAAHERASATVGFYERKGGHLLRVLGADRELGDLERGHLVAYVSQRKLETASSSTIHKELCVLRRVLAEATDRGLWVGDVRKLVPTIKVDYKPKKTWLDEHQVKQLLERVAADRRLWVTIAIWGGLCLGEIERLTWAHVDLAGGTLDVPGTKRNTRARTIPLAPVLRRALELAAYPRKPAQLRSDTRFVVTPWTNVRRALRGAAEAARLPDHLRKLSPNDLRRTFASLMLNAGQAPIVVAKLLGHSGLKMVELVYGQISARTFAAAVGTLPESDLSVTAAREAGEKNTSANAVSCETDETSCAGSCSGQIAAFSVEESPVVLVPRDGVEPPTRGFSGLGHPSKTRRLKAV